MNRIIRQAFGTTRPGEIYHSLLTFDRLVTKPIVHIVYWAGLCLFFLGACGVAGMAVGQALQDGNPMAWLLAFGLTVVGWLLILIGVLIWRSACEFYMAVLSIAEDLRTLRQYQEKLEMPTSAAPVAAPQPHVQPAAETFAPKIDPLKFEPPAEDSEPVAPTPETGNILEDPFFRPRFRPD
jgi:hypothetical protein